MTIWTFNLGIVQFLMVWGVAFAICAVVALCVLWLIFQLWPSKPGSADDAMGEAVGYFGGLLVAFLVSLGIAIYAYFFR